jgi:hypothetical protein
MTTKTIFSRKVLRSMDLESGKLYLMIQSWIGPLIEQTFNLRIELVPLKSFELPCVAGNQNNKWIACGMEDVSVSLRLHSRNTRCFEEESTWLFVAFEFATEFSRMEIPSV